MATTEGLVFELVDNDYYVVSWDYTTNLVNLEIPSSYKDPTTQIEKPVKKIKENAFYSTLEHYSHLETVIIPNSIIEIGESAFRENRRLKNITLPNSQLKINMLAFNWCIIENVYYNGSINEWCSNITFALDDSNPLQYAKHFYTKNTNDVYQEISGAVKIESNIINNYALCGFKNISKLILSNTTIINYYSFSSTNLKEVILSNSLTRILGSAFASCSLLETIFIPITLTNISNNVFYNCSNIKNVLYEGIDESAWNNNITIGNNNTYLTNAKRYYFSANEPNEDDAYWHYTEDFDFAIWTVKREPITYTINNNTIKDGYKTMIVPIKVNTDYTIYIDSSIPIYIAAIYYDGINVLTDYNKNNNTYTVFDYTLKTHCSFNQPFIYRIDKEETFTEKEGSTANETILQNQLVMLIQIPEINTSTVLVLEGDYTQNKLINIQENNQPRLNSIKELYYGKPLKEIEEKNLLERYFSSVSSLTQIFDGENYAFNDRLIEYLLLNVITQNDDIGDNIKRIQEYISSYKSLSQLGERYKNTYIKGVWDLQMRQYIYNLITQKYNKPIGIDINGFVDKDTEAIIEQCKEKK